MSNDDLTPWDEGSNTDPPAHAGPDDHAESVEHDEDSRAVEPEPAPVFQPPAIGGVSDLVTWWAAVTGHTRCEDLPDADLASNIEVVFGAEDNSTSSALASATAAAVTGLLTGRDAPSTTTSFVDDSGLIDHELWMTQCAATRDEMARLRSVRNDSSALREQVEAQLGPLVDRLADNPTGRGVLVDGAIAAGAALLAYELNPEMLVTTRPLQIGETAVAAIVWDYLRVTPVLAVRSNLIRGELAPAAVGLINNLVEISRRDARAAASPIAEPAQIHTT